MSRKNNDLQQLLSALAADLPPEEVMLVGLQGLIAGEITIKRHEKGLSQKRFAAMMGVSQGMVSRWENGDANFTLETLVKIAKALDIRMQCPFVTKRPVVYSFSTIGNLTQFPGQWIASDYHAEGEYEDLVEM